MANPALESSPPVTRLVLAVLFAAAGFWVSAAEPTRPSPSPNVILIVTDDQGAVDAGCYGAKDLATPNIDALAARGVRFTQFYAAAPVCSPSRAGLLTGRYPLHVGLTGNAASQPGGKEAMSAAQITMAEVFKAAAYVTGHVGKWHLGYTPQTMPNAQGFDFSFGHMGGCIDNFSHFFYWQGPNRHDLYRNGVEVQKPGRYFPDLMVEEASQFLEENRSKPFFLYFALNTPHYPYQAEPDWLEHYKALPYPRNLYAAFLSSCDSRIGALLKKVDDLGLRQKTIVVFQSDNGHSMEERAHFGGGSAGPYRGQKFSLFEGGIRLPAIISWTGQLPEGEVRSQVVHACDWLPTLIELCGLSAPKSVLDGRSIVPVIRSARAPSPHSELHWQVGGGTNKPQWAVRQGNWKLIGNVETARDTNLTAADKKLFLSNLAEDVSERTNFAREFPEAVKRLQRLHDDWAGTNRGSSTDAASAVDEKGNER
jgi:arylsulfatase A-like enzyme